MAHIIVLCQQAHSPRLNALNPMPGIYGPHLFQAGIRRPVANGPLVCMFHHIAKARFDYHILEVWLYIHLLARFQAAIDSEFAGAVEGVAVDFAAIVRFGDGVDLAVLEISAWLEMTRGRYQSACGLTLEGALLTLSTPCRRPASRPRCRREGGRGCSRSGLVGIPSRCSNRRARTGGSGRGMLAGRWRDRSLCDVSEVVQEGCSVPQRTYHVCIRISVCKVPRCGFNLVSSVVGMLQVHTVPICQCLSQHRLLSLGCRGVQGIACHQASRGTEDV